jgi:hypothetical protein
MSLQAPKAVVFIISLILFIIAWIGPLTPIPLIDAHPSAAYIVLALGCFL